MFKAYVIRQGLTGCYMPDNVAYFTRKSDALQYAASLARECRDDGYIVNGTAKYGYTYAWPDQYDDTAYCIEFDFIGFSTKAQRDKFITENADF